MKDDQITSIPSSGNIFADMGLEDADELLARAELVHMIRKLYDLAWLTQQMLYGMKRFTHCWRQDDADFSQLAFSAHLPARSGVVLFRIAMNSPDQVARVILSALQTREDWQGHFSVVEDHRIRMTPLPN